jgi:uncharacterized protein
MIDRTFQHIPGVGPWREKDLWARGITRWSDFPGPGEGVCLSRDLDPQARERIALARTALEARDLSALGRLLPAREHWRLYGAFAEEAVFFDIETEGTGQRPTVVSLFHRDGLECFLLGRNLDGLVQALERHRLWVTFNGSCYDVPILKEHYPQLKDPSIHLDLRFIYQRLGRNTGLKQLEDDLGISRPPHLKGVKGYDAVLLWRAYQETGDIAVLRLLVEYNLYDAIQLRSLLDLAYNRAAEDLACDVPKLTVFDRGDVLYDVSRLLLSLAPTAQDLDRLERVRRAAELDG